MRELLRGLLLSVAGVSLVGCAGATRLTKPIETYGKALSAVETAVGDGGATYRKATRTQLLHHAQTHRVAPSSDPPLIAVAAATAQPKPTVSIVERYFICRPLEASFPAAKAQGDLKALGDTLTETATASPTNVVGLLMAVSKDYNVKWPESKTANPEAAQIVLKQCALVVGEAFAPAADPTTPSPAADPDLLELNGLNQHAWAQGTPSGPQPNVSVAVVFAVLEAIDKVLTAVLTQADQGKREQAINVFFSNPENTAKLRMAIRYLDHASRVSQLGARADAKAGFRARWVTLARLEAGPGATLGTLGEDPELFKASQELVTSAAELDQVISQRSADVIAKRTYDEVNACRNANKDAECPRSALGAALYKAVTQLEAAAKKDWKNMTEKDRIAYVEGAMGVLTALVGASNDLATFENDKENFRKLMSIVDALPG
jgi:hypothetical protein